MKRYHLSKVNLEFGIWTRCLNRFLISHLCRVSGHPPLFPPSCRLLVQQESLDCSTGWTVSSHTHWRVLLPRTWDQTPASHQTSSVSWSPPRWSQLTPHDPDTGLRCLEWSGGNWVHLNQNIVDYSYLTMIMLGAGHCSGVSQYCVRKWLPVTVVDWEVALVSLCLCRPDDTLK